MMERRSRSGRPGSTRLKISSLVSSTAEGSGGALSGGTKREIQEFRDALTEDLKDAIDQPLTNDSLANDVFWGIRNVSSVQPKILALTTPIPADTEAILYIAVIDLSINVQDDIAIIATTATARLARYSDGATLYRKEVTYADRDTLSNWTRDDTALWRTYRNYARHYIGREISAEVYERIELHYELAPLASDRAIWIFVSRLDGTMS